MGKKAIEHMSNGSHSFALCTRFHLLSDTHKVIFSKFSCSYGLLSFPFHFVFFFFTFSISFLLAFFGVCACDVWCVCLGLGTLVDFCFFLLVTFLFAWLLKFRRIKSTRLCTCMHVYARTCMCVRYEKKHTLCSELWFDKSEESSLNVGWIERNCSK